MVRERALAIYLMATGIKGTSSMHLHRDLGVTQKTTWTNGRYRHADGCELHDGRRAGILDHETISKPGFLKYMGSTRRHR